MKKFVSTTLSVLILSTMLALPASAAIRSNVPQDVQKFALTEGLAHAKKMFSIEPTDIGLTNTEEISKLKVGPGLQMNVIDWELVNKSMPSSMLSFVKPMQKWDFILEKDGKPVTSMIVGKDKGKLYVARLGGSTENFHQAWSKFDTETNATEPVLVVDKNVRYLVGKYQEQELAVPELGEDRADVLNNITNRKLWQAADIVKTLIEKEEAATARNTSGLAGGGGAVPANQLSNERDNISFIMACAVGLLGVIGIGAYFVRKKASK